MMRSRAALSALPRGAGALRELVITNTGQATAAAITIVLDSGGEDYAHLLSRRRPETLEPKQEFALRVSQVEGPRVFKVIITWTDPDGDDGRWIGVMVR